MIMKCVNFSIIILATSISSLFLSAQVNGQCLVKYADAVDGIDAENIGIYIEDIKTGDVLLDINGEKFFTPASVTKMLTIASLVETADLNQRYFTTVYADGELSDSIFLGNIVIESSGDPTLESSYFKEYNGFADSIASSICKLGITEFNGAIIINEPKWIEYDIPSGWKDSDLTWPYGAGYHGFNYRDNKAVITISKGDKWSTSPEIPGLNVVFTSAKLSDDLYRNKGTKTITAKRTKKKSYTHTIANPDPSSTFIKDLETALENHGIKTNIQSEQQHSGAPSQCIYIHKSPTLNEIAHSTMLRSDNMMAEGLLRIAHPELSRLAAIDEELSQWDKTGWERSGIVVEDGSGLSRNNKISPYALADILSWMYINSEKFQDFLDMFPIAAQTGTLRNFMKDNNLAGQFRAKTGSLNGVQCYAGYVIDKYGQPSHIVIVMINGMKSERSAIKKNIEILLENYCTFVDTND